MQSFVPLLSSFNLIRHTSSAWHWLRLRGWHLRSSPAHVIWVSDSFGSLSHFLFEFWKKPVSPSHSCAYSLSCSFKMWRSCCANLSGHVSGLFRLDFHIELVGTGNPFLELSHVKGLTRWNASDLFNRLEIGSETGNLLLHLFLSLGVSWGCHRKFSIVAWLSVSSSALEVNNDVRT